MQKIKAFLESEKGKRLIYEAKSFTMTFLSTYMLVAGISNASTISELLENKEVLLASISVALFRTVVIYTTRIVGFNYRQDTADFK